MPATSSEIGDPASVDFLSLSNPVVISHQHRFIFIKTRKTASTSIEVFLSQQCPDSDVFTPITPPVENHRARNYEGLWNPFREYRVTGGWRAKRMALELLQRQRFYNHMPAVIVRGRISEDIWTDYFKFCVERNPWDKTISHFAMLKDRSAGELTFAEYFQQGNFCQNYPLYLDRNGNLLVDRVIKYERLNDELQEVFDMLGIPFTTGLGVRAKSGYRKKQAIDSAEIDAYRQEIEAVYRKEIDMHGYEFIDSAS